MIRIFCLCVVVSTLFLGNLAANDPWEGIYPPAKNCFQGVPENVPMRLDEIKFVNEDCLETLSIEKMQENAVCFKACVLKDIYVISNSRFPDVSDLWTLSNISSYQRDQLQEERTVGYNYSVDRKHSTYSLINSFATSFHLVEPVEYESELGLSSKRVIFKSVFAVFGICRQISQPSTLCS